MFRHDKSERTHALTHAMAVRPSGVRMTLRCKMSIGQCHGLEKGCRGLLAADAADLMNLSGRQDPTVIRRDCQRQLRSFIC